MEIVLAEQVSAIIYARLSAEDACYYFDMIIFRQSRMPNQLTTMKPQFSSDVCLCLLPLIQCAAKRRWSLIHEFNLKKTWMMLAGHRRRGFVVTLIKQSSSGLATNLELRAFLPVKEPAMFPTSMA